ncbi:hypothetical protein C475_19493 [Halosimplex carlsbadense 2-9-1]|uniref:Uncharacterized protein n=2 Tax=Halosimplex carlsbadense TaxID=171164 RepID=M0CC03_9EURY|nr:hypothetical protein C475_19493 [Halosimplex carlsbadense 2-9-1]
MMQFGWILALTGIGASLFSSLPRYVAGFGGVAVALVGIGLVVVGARVRDGRWLVNSQEVTEDVEG